MEIVRLGPLGSTSYLPDILIEGYDSMIWTERFQEPGDFQLKTSLIDATRKLLPEKTLISHLDTKDVMMVDSHAISVNAEGLPELTVTGRSVDAFFEHRHVEGPYGKRRLMVKEYSPVGAAAVLMWNAIDNHTDNDVTREGSHSVSLNNKVPNVMISDSAPNDPSKRWWLKEGPLYPQLMDILIRWDMGIRVIRPLSEDATKVAVETGAANRGDVKRELVLSVSALRFDLFKGVDRSHLQTVRSPVIFNTLHGDVDGANYLFSMRDYKTACEMMSSVKFSSDTVYRSGSGDSSLSGWDRRAMSYDAGEPEEPTKPADPGKNATKAQNDKYEADLASWQNKVNDIRDKFRSDARDEARRALKKQRRVSLFTGDISPAAPYTFKNHYNLGDTVTLYGDYGQYETMIVDEYVRTEDSEGDRGYPGLATA